MEHGEVRTSFCGTFEYMSPEIILNNIHSSKTDVWSLGVLLYEMLHGSPFIKSRDREKTRVLLET